MDLRLDDSLIKTLAPADLAAGTARAQWLHQARPKQMPPAGDDWDTCVWIAGRFFGKTRVIVEASWWEAWRLPGIRIHALAPTLGDVRRVLFEGESGFIAKMPSEIVKGYNKSDKEIYLNNGSTIFGFSVVEEADRLRGPQCHDLLFDEAAAADRPAGNLEAAYRVAALGCRLIRPDGTSGKKLIATTPRPIPFLKSLIKRPNVRLIQGTSHENLKNVSTAARNEVLSLAGTTYGRQEVEGQFVDEGEMSIFKRNWFRLWPAEKKLPEFSFVLESYDTATKEKDFDKKKQTRDPTACTIWGVFNIPQQFNEDERKRLRLRSRYGVILCDVWTDYLEFPELLERARKQHRIKWGSPGRKPDLTLIEEASSGIQLRQTLAKYGVPTWPHNPHSMSKTMRAHAVSPIVAQGMVFIPESAVPERAGLPRDWVEPFLNEVCAFAGVGSTPHDDMLDTMTAALLYFNDRNLLEVEPEEKFVDLEEKKERDQEKAVRIHEDTRERTSPYGS